MAKEFIITEHQFICDRHHLPEYLLRRLGYTYVVTEGLAHLVDTVCTFQKGHGQHHLGLQTIIPLEFPPYKEVELLVSPAYLHVGLQRHGIITLDQRIEELMDRYGLAAFVSLVKIVPLQHPCHVVPCSQAYQIKSSNPVHPLAVKSDLGLFRVEYLEDLLFIGL